MCKGLWLESFVYIVCSLWRGGVDKKGDGFCRASLLAPSHRAADRPAPQAWR